MPLRRSPIPLRRPLAASEPDPSVGSRVDLPRAVRSSSHPRRSKSRSPRLRSNGVRSVRPITVVKYGGSIVGTPARLAAAGKQIRGHDSGPLVVVVSAPGDLTDRLLGFSQLATVDFPPSSRADLLRQGEEIGVRLLGGVLRSLGVEHRLLLPGAPDWPVILTGGPFNAAVDLAAVRERAHRLFPPGAPDVVLVPGFVGVDSSGFTAVLPRGGSDLTAVALGRALGATEVVLVKDVPGLLFADPGLLRDPPRVPSIDANEMQVLADAGCPLIAPEAVRFVPRGLAVRVTGLDGPLSGSHGTLIQRSASPPPVPHHSSTGSTGAAGEPPSEPGVLLTAVPSSRTSRSAERRALRGSSAVRKVWWNRGILQALVPPGEVRTVLESLAHSGEFRAVACRSLGPPPGDRNGRWKPRG